MTPINLEAVQARHDSARYLEFMGRNDEVGSLVAIEAHADRAALLSALRAHHEALKALTDRVAELHAECPTPAWNTVERVGRAIDRARAALATVTPATPARGEEETT